MPEGYFSVTYDSGNNHWCLVPAENKRESVLMLLSADSNVWTDSFQFAPPSQQWQAVLADEHGYLWLQSEDELLCKDLRNSYISWIDIRSRIEFPRGKFTQLLLGADGSAMLVIDRKWLWNLDIVKSGEAQEIVYEFMGRPILLPDISAIDEVIVTDLGSLVIKNGIDEIWINDPDAWQQNWTLVARLPGSNHDLRGDVLDGKFYMAGGLTAEYGYPYSSHAYSELFEFCPKENLWNVVVDLGIERIYCATGILGDQIWVLGGDILSCEGKDRKTTRLVQIVDPGKGVIDTGPPLNHELPAPLAFQVNERLYILGFQKYNKEVFLKIESIASGETRWRKEPDGPTGKGALYGCAFGDRIYAVVAGKYVAVFDTRSSNWSTIDLPSNVRSPQVSHLNGELWIMGGRDIENQAEVWICNLKDKKWRPGPDLPREMAWGVGFNIDEKLYVTGGAAGRCYNNRTFMYKSEK